MESLRRRYAGKFILKPLLWEELPLQHDMSFQQGMVLVPSQDRGCGLDFPAPGGNGHREKHFLTS